MTPPPGAASFDDFPEPMARAFEAAFGPSQQEPRPSAARLWAQVAAIKIPPRSQLTPTLSPVTAQPSAAARAAKFKREGYRVASYAAFVVAGLVLISVPKFWLISLGFVIGGFVLRSQEVDVASSLRQRFVATETQWDTALEDWEKRCGIDQIERLKSKRLDEIPGVGPALATALVASVADPRAFRSGRDFSAWVGLVPKQNSSGGKEKLGSITKRGDRYLRSLFTAGALAVIRYAKIHGTKHRPWLTALLARRTTKVAAIALANKIARMAWAMMAKGERYKEPAALAA